MSIQFYEQNADAFFRGSIDADMAADWQAFAAELQPGDRILDAGCGSGRDALGFSRLGFRVTAMEASPKLAALARRHAGLPVEVLTFDQVSWREAFEGVWACASLLHVPRAQLAGAVRRLCNALVPGGLLWMSFKYGTQERHVAGRDFTDLDEAGADAVLAEVGGLELIWTKVSGDVRPGREAERWLSLLCRKP